MNLGFMETLVPALLHTLWIGLLSAIFLYTALRAVSAARVSLRYALGLVSLLAVFLGGLLAWELPKTPAENRTHAIIQGSPSHSSDLSLTSEPVASPVAFHATAAAPRPVGKTDWWKIAGILWMLGTVISLLRMIRLSLGIQRLVRQSGPIGNPGVQRMVAELSKVAGFSRRVLLLTGEHIVQPAVVGIFRPALFLPLSALSGLPEWQLRAILAHELAHIVRHDFLANALQLLAETILFFNPAVWWINRRIREEREACCDAFAAEWIDSKIALAETLIEQAAIHSNALPAFAGPDNGSLKNRILRLINPSRQPHLKLPWKSLLLVLVFAIGGLFLAKKGTDGVVGYIQRLQKLEAARGEYATPTQKILRESNSTLEKMWLELTIKTEDGAPLPLPLRLDCSNRGGSYSWEARISENILIERISPSEAKFRVNLSDWAEAGCVERFSIAADGYAQYAGTGGAADTNGIIRVAPATLSKGFTGQIRFVDPAGNPVPGLRVMSSQKSSSGSWSIIPAVPVQTDGTLTQSNCSNGPFRLKLYPPDGYAYDEGDHVFKPGETGTWVLKPAKPFSGCVVDPAGNPIKGAKIYLFGNGTLSLRNIPFATVETTSDTQGRFNFTRMLPDEKYTLAIEANGYFGKFSKSLSASDIGERIVLHPGGKMTVHFRNMNPDKWFYCSRAYTYVSDEGGRCTAGAPEEWMQQISKNATEATYALTRIWEGENYISAEDVHYSFDAPLTNRVINLDIAQLREEQDRTKRKPVSVAVSLNFIPPKDEPLPTGSVKLSYVMGNMGKSLLLPIPENGRIQTNLMINPKSSFTVSSGPDLKGYAIYEYYRISSTRLDIDCPVLPAGGIVLTCQDSKGNPITGYSAHVGIRYERKDGNHSSSSTDDNYMTLLPGQTGTPTCMFEPLDFRNKYKVWVHLDRPEEEGGPIEYNGNWFSLSKHRPVKKMTCVLKLRK